MRKLLYIILLLAAALPGTAQEDAQQQASQQAKLVMSNAIDITFTATNDDAGGTVSLAFSNVNDYANGIESDLIEMRVRSNKKFRIQAKTNSSRFTYTGTTTPAPQMNVSNVLFMKISDNKTGGSVSSNFNNKFRTMSSSNQTLISNGTPGDDQTFNVQYKATPGFSFPAGTYAVNVVYTATQM